MPLGTITVLDGNSVPITVQVLGTTSPFTWGHVLIDGVGGSNIAQVTSGNALKVDGSAIIQPVSFPGGITVSGAVSITQGGNTANVTGAGALKVDTTGITTVVSGAVTANIGTAGPLALETGGNLAAIAATYVTSGTALGTIKGQWTGGVVSVAAPTYAAGQISPVSLNTAGGLRVDGSGVTQPVSGSVAVAQGGQTAVVKAASTAPVAADPALVVALSPNSALSLGSVSIAQGGNTAAVKAASTVPAATDPALVVSISPNSQNANGPNTMANSSPVTIASDQSNLPAIAGGSQYKAIAASTSGSQLGATGAVGDYLEGISCVVATAATSQVQIQDGAGALIVVLPNNVGPGIGTYYVALGIKATGAGWKVTTAAGVSAIATGKFT
jgi:hypothetical protein